MKLIKSFKYAIVGIITAFNSEKNLKIHFFATVLVIFMGFYFKISKLEWITVLLTVSSVISAELFNTAIEETVNIASPNINELAKKAKDISAGAVLFSAIIALIIGMIIFFPKILNII